MHTVNDEEYGNDITVLRIPYSNSTVYFFLSLKSAHQGRTRVSGQP